MLRTYYFKNVGTIDTGENIQNVIAITERPMNGLDPWVLSGWQSVDGAIAYWLRIWGTDGIIYKFVIARDLR